MTGRRAGARRPTLPARSDTVVWHDVECGGYAADLATWRDLADRCGGPVLELGAGTGRVALDLAARGHVVSALDSDPDLVRELAARARERGLRVSAHCGDARSFELNHTFALVIAPMQVLQLLGGAAGRSAMLARVRHHLPPGGVLAAALADPLEDLPAEGALPPLPDVRELDGWVCSSLPVGLREAGGGIEIERVREAVSPTGELHQSAAKVTLDDVDPGELAAAAAEVGFRRLRGRRIAPTDAHVGSDIVILEAT